MPVSTRRIAAVQRPQPVRLAQHRDLRPRLRLGPRCRPMPDQLAAFILELRHIRPCCGILSRRSGRGWRREILQHPALLIPPGKGVVPGVLLEKHRLAGLDQMHLAVLGVGDDHRAHQHRQHLIRAKDGAEAFRMAKPVTRRHAEHQLVDLVGRDIDPVVDLPRRRIPPQMPRDRGVGDRRRAVEHRAGRGFIGHQSLRCVVKMRGGAVTDLVETRRHESWK